MATGIWPQHRRAGDFTPSGLGQRRPANRGPGQWFNAAPWKLEGGQGLYFSTAFLTDPPFQLGKELRGARAGGRARVWGVRRCGGVWTSPPRYQLNKLLLRQPWPPLSGDPPSVAADPLNDLIVPKCILLHI
jgi:hypothetical protein